MRRHLAAHPGDIPPFGQGYSLDLADVRVAVTGRRHMALGLATLALATLALATGAARADRARVQVGVGTDVPLDVGARLAVELPYRLRATAVVGVLPGPYLDGINAGLVAAGAYPEETAALIRASLAQAVVVRTHVGVRPLARHGLTVEVGHGLIALGGGATGAAIIEAATGRPAPPGESGRDFDVTSRLHQLDVEVGWEWRLPARLIVRAAIGGAFTVAAVTTITPDYQPTAPRATAQFTDAGAAYLDTTYTSYVHAPLVSVALAWTP